MTKEQLNFYGALRPPDHCTHLSTAPGVDWLYVDRNAGRRGLMGVKDLVREEERLFYRYMEN